MVVTSFLCRVIHITDSCCSSLRYLFVRLYSHLVRSFPYHLPSPYICRPRQTPKYNPISPQKKFGQHSPFLLVGGVKSMFLNAIGDRFGLTNPLLRIESSNPLLRIPFHNDDSLEAVPSLA